MLSSNGLEGIELEILWSRFASIMEEAENTLLRLSFSTVIGEARDFACVMLDRELRTVATARMVIPGFTLTLPYTVAHFIDSFPAETLEPKDVIVTNDPWKGSGHLSDLSIATPVFYRDKLVGYVACCAHVSDIGGTVGYHTGRDVYEEGLAIPISKLRNANRVNDFLIELIRANVRVPDMVTGDIMAMVAALDVAERRIVETLDEMDLAELIHFSSAANDRAGSAMRQALKAIPDGSYIGSYTFDGYEQPLKIKAQVSVDGSDAEVDFSGTSPQQDLGAINAPFSMSRAEVLYAFKYMLTPEVPTCSGLFAPIEILAPEGTLLNPTRPSAVKARSKTSFHIPEAIFQALEHVLPDRVQAGSGHSTYIIINGIDEQGRAYNSFYLPGGGMGATSERDGPDCTLFPTNTTITPVEVLETTTPLIVQKKELLADSGGAGRRRGGMGQRVRIASRAKEPVTVTLRPEDRICAPKGLQGGMSGQKSQITVNSDEFDGDLVRLEYGDVLEVDLPGGGGFGQPADRENEAIMKDLEAGLLSPERASRVYGIDTGDTE